MNSSSDDDESGTCSLRNSDQSVGFAVDMDSDDEPIDTLSLSNNVSADRGDYVLVKFGAKRHFYYVGIVENVAAESVLCYTIKYFRRENKRNCFYEPTVEDIGLAMKSDIVAKSSRPENCPGTSRSRKKSHLVSILLISMCDK